MRFSRLAAIVPLLITLPFARAVPLAELYADSTEYHQLQRRVDTQACKLELPFAYYIRRSSLDLDKQTGPDDCRQGNIVPKGQGYQLPATTVSRTPFEVYKGDNFGTMTGLEVGAVTGPGTHTCDHILEVGVVQRVIEAPGGLCEAAKKLIDAADGDQVKIDDVKEKLNNIVRILNGPNNLVFLQTNVEKIKGKMVNWVRDGKIKSKNPVLIRSKKNKKKKITYSGGQGFWLAGGVLDYLDGKTESVGLAVADAIDDAIKKDFPEAKAGFDVRYSWEKVYLAAMKKELKLVQVAAINAISDATCDAPAAGTSSRRSTILSARSGFEVYSSLTVRAAARGVKTGPKAPPGRCCPAKNATQKKNVPRSQVKTKPKPVTKPRAPATRPQARPPSAKKQVVPRPASRAKRVAGQPAQRKRSTPRTKPRVVPKPTQRPRGKPRTRRRR